MTVATLTDLSRHHRTGDARGITAVCSAHPLILRAALQHGRDHASTVLIEATCNQVNHQGGYTGMTAADFSDLVYDLARQEGCPHDLIVLGGDHLGPHPWRHLPSEKAMVEAGKMIESYAAAGFRKLHLDTSMGCADETAPLSDAVVAQRAAHLASRAEAVATHSDLPAPFYIIGTEVPPPGGVDHALDTITPTTPEAARQTIAVHKAAFTEHGLTGMMNRIVGLVVQTGAEFGIHNVNLYDPVRACGLSCVLDDHDDLVFEAHSTDYQGVEALTALVKDGFAILKVGPELTFILRETLYALDLIASDLLPEYGQRSLYHVMEEVMLTSPENWASHYPGNETEQRVMRHYSLSDRIRYYWPAPTVQAAVTRLLNSLRKQSVPLPLMRQHLPDAVAFAGQPLNPEEVIIRRVRDCLETYHCACIPKGA